jgi:hypothetical protein
MINGICGGSRISNKFNKKKDLRFQFMQERHNVVESVSFR